MWFKESGSGHTKKESYINSHTCFKQCIPASGSGAIYYSTKPMIHKIYANIAIVKKRKERKKKKANKNRVLITIILYRNMANLPPTLSNPPIRPPYGPTIGPPYTVVMNMNSCGLNTANQDKNFATEALMYEFERCKDMSNEDLAECFKTFSGLTVGQGEIRPKPQTAA